MGKNKKSKMTTGASEGTSEHHELKVGCLVEVWLNGKPVGGIVKWAGDIDNSPHVGIEFEDPIGSYSEWSHLIKLVTCKYEHCILKPIARVKRIDGLKILGCQNQNPRALENKPECSKQPVFDLSNHAEFIVPPMNLKDFISYNGQKGVQGRSNSCYLDSTLFSMFAFSAIFDHLLLHGNYNSQSYTSCESGENSLAENIKILLGKYIVNNLRTEYYCPAEPILKLRELLLPVNAKVQSNHMDVEELMFLVFDKVFHLEGFITYDTGDSDFLHQIDTSVLKRKPYVMTTQRLLESSMNLLKMKFMTVPKPALILEMPRSDGKLVHNLKVVLPSLTLDLTNLILGGPRNCWICNGDAVLECLDCFDGTNEKGINSTFLCTSCAISFHLHPQRVEHRNVKQIYEVWRETRDMELVAVICIRAHHFVSFVRTGLGPWVFCDSNPGGKFPITEVLHDFDKSLNELTEMCETEIMMKLESMSPMLKRILTDSHICIYGARLTQKFEIKQETFV